MHFIDSKLYLNKKEYGKVMFEDQAFTKLYQAGLVSEQNSVYWLALALLGCYHLINDLLYF